LRELAEVFQKKSLEEPDHLIEVSEGCTPWVALKYPEYSNMYHELLRHASFWAFLFSVDEDLAKIAPTSLLTVILCGDGRLQELLRQEDLIPLGTRICTRLHTEPASRDDLLTLLRHALSKAGNATLMTAQLMDTLVDHPTTSSAAMSRAITCGRGSLCGTTPTHRRRATSRLVALGILLLLRPSSPHATPQTS
jgi:hypothetical protein